MTDTAETNTWPPGTPRATGDEVPPYVWIDVGHVDFPGEWPEVVPTAKGKVAVNAIDGGVLNPQPDYPEWNPPEPPPLPDGATITGLDPSSVVVDTPTTVTITGTNFAPGMQVLVDGQSFPSATFVDSAHATFTAQASSAGHQDVRVVVAGQVSEAASLTVTAS